MKIEIFESEYTGPVSASYTNSIVKKTDTIPRVGEHVSVTFENGLRIYAEVWRVHHDYDENFHSVYVKRLA